MRLVPALALLIALAATSPCNARSFSSFGAVAVPLGDFGDDKGAEAGLAMTGFGFGGELFIPVNRDGLGVIVSGMFVSNGVDEGDFVVGGFKEGTFEQDGVTVTIGNVDVDAGLWVNIPILAGLKLQREVSAALKVYGQGTGGVTIVKAPKIMASGLFSATDGGVTVKGRITGEIEWDTAASFGFGLGGGVVISDRFDCGVRYMYLGDPEIDGSGTVTLSTGGNTDSYPYLAESFHQSISTLCVYGGVRF